MKIVSVAAAGNGSGKTLTIAAILRSFPGRFTAVKFTTVARDGANCPRTETACACRSLKGPFTIVDDPGVLEAEDTDTGRLARAGATSVLWCLCAAGAHAGAWRHLREAHLHGAPAIVTEGNTAIPHLDPDLLVMVMRPGVPRRRWKPDTLGLARRADILIVNPHGSRPQETRDLVHEMASLRGQAPSVQDVSLPLSDWADRSLLQSLAALLDPRPEGG